MTRPVPIPLMSWARRAPWHARLVRYFRAEINVVLAWLALVTLGVTVFWHVALLHRVRTLHVALCHEHLRAARLTQPLFDRLVLPSDPCQAVEKVYAITGQHPILAPTSLAVHATASPLPKRTSTPQH